MQGSIFFWTNLVWIRAYARFYRGFTAKYCTAPGPTQLESHLTVILQAIYFVYCRRTHVGPGWFWTSPLGNLLQVPASTLALCRFVRLVVYYGPLLCSATWTPP
ncbi:hypothetical protein EDB86DRAFT_2909716, partial [Lactarius hatsudake]